MTTNNKPIHKYLEPSFEMNLQYKEGLEPITTFEGRIGEYLGSGVGTIESQSLQGTVRWDLYEVVGDVRCQTNFAGIIETEDGAKIEFDAKGFGLVPDSTKPSEWRMANVVQFDTEDSRYEWLNTVPAFWDGTFDLETYTHQYQIYTGTN